jgi:hypothetical protein
VDFLQVAVGHLSLQMKISPSLICTVADLRLLIKAALDEDSTRGTSLLDEGWRKQHIRPILEGILRGDYALRIGNMDALAPLEFTAPSPVSDE